MKVWRKPASALWYYDRAQFVDDVNVSSAAWTGIKYIVFDGTKDKRGRRHTDIRLALSEAEVENLYLGLVKGRKAEARRLDTLERKIENLISQIRDKYLAANAGSKKEALMREFIAKLREL